MNSAEVLRKAMSLLPGPLTLAVVLSPAPGFELPKYFAAASCFALFIGSLLIRSDSLHTISLSGLAILLGLASSQGGFLLSFAVVTSLLVLLDVASLVKSLFGLTYSRIDRRYGDTPSAYLDIIRRKAVRSSGVGLATFLVSLAIISTPTASITFANPVSGSGLLALATLLLIILAASGAGRIGLVFRRQVRPSRE